MTTAIPFRTRSRGEWIARCSERLRELLPMFTDAAGYSTAMALYPRGLESLPEEVAEQYTAGSIGIFASHGPGSEHVR